MVKPVTGAERLVELHAAELPQKDELCGAFWGTLALRAAGIRSVAEIDQDAVGQAAGSFISDAPGEGLPPGEAGRGDYRLAFPRIDDPGRSGTSATGLVRALREISGGMVSVVPVAGPWSRGSVLAVMDAVAGCREPCTPIANLATRHLWGARPSPAALLQYLSSGDADRGPSPDWDVGHFVGLLGTVSGPGGTLLIVADTYRSIGWEGLHLQPAERMARALERTGSARPSGVILVVSPVDAPDVETRIRAAGLRIDTWDNGSLDAREAAGGQPGG